MIGVRLSKSKVLGGVAAGVLAAVLGVAPAYAEAVSPWWGLTQSARPTNLQAGVGGDEVQEITVSATEGDFYLEDPVSKSSDKTSGGVPYDATHEEVQQALEGLYGAGNVEVPEGQGDEGGDNPYVIKFIGGLSGQPVELVDVGTGEVFSCALYKLCPLKGGGKSVKASQVTKGAPDGQIVVMAENLGDGDASGATEPVRILDTLPSGLKATAVEAYAGSGTLAASGSALSCSPEPASESPLSCTFAGVVHPYEVIEVTISVIVQPGAVSGEENQASVSGGGAVSTRTIRRPIQIGGEPRFGVQENLFVPEEAGGSIDTQAGSHPFQLTSVVGFNLDGEPSKPVPVALPKDVGVLAPSGLVGNPTPLAQCTDSQFVAYSEDKNNCPRASQIGVADISFYEPATTGLYTSVAPVFNMVPEAGEPARFGFYAYIVPVMLNTSVRTGGDYGVTVTSHNTIQVAGLLSATVTLWGVPGDARHDGQRGYACLEHTGTCALSSEVESTPPPFLSLPTSCTGPLQAGALVDSWERPQEVLPVSLTEPMLGQGGCNHLPFSPGISVAPDVPDGSTPTGLTVDVHVPQTAALNPEGLAESTLRDTTVVLPEGVTVTPGGADGLEACSESQIGFEGQEPGGGAMLFTPGFSSCPAASKIATVSITTPLLPNPLKGAVYLATPAPNGEAGMNPFNSLIAMYLVAEDPVSGVLVKLPGKVVPNLTTGQLTSTFEDTPQLPFEDLELHFFGGGRAPLATPSLCGSYTTRASFTPWSGNAAVQSSSTFQVTSGPNGSACQDPLPFDPEFETGTTNIQAGAFSELRTTMGHPDADQTLGGLSMTLPPGLMGSLAHVELCGEPQANAGTCGPESLVGHTVVTAGLGSEPVVVKRPGNVYITGPYNGHGACTVGEAGCAPFGLSIVNPAEAGPFNLGEVVVRAKIEVDPHTAQLTVLSDPLPTIIKGIPLQIQHVAVTIERPDFTFNPTSCSKMQIEGSMSSSQGTVARVSSPLQVTNCASLKFAPKFAVSTSGKTSKADGASLSVKLTYPNTPQDTEANIARVKVDLPKQLPSRLTTLQKACLAATFEANPASCPAASVVGHAKAITPILPVPLEGPAYFVSHGGEAFPSLIVVLQGYGVTVDLVGSTFISKAGITSSTFKTVPDVPVGSFELTLPEGKYSALAANGSLCTSKLEMPTAFAGQNGAQIKQSTPIEAEGCPNTLSFISHKIKKRTLTVSAYAPAAGKLTIDGKGLKPVSKTAKQREAITFKVKQKKAGRLKTTIKATFTPSTSKDRKKQSKSLKVTFKK